MINIRPAAEQDASEVFKLTSSARHKAYLALIDLSQQTDFLSKNRINTDNFNKWNQHFTKYASNSNYTCMVAELDGKVVGWYCLRNDVEEYVLMYLFVDPNYQGKGTGRKLLNDALSRAKTKHTRLSVLSANSRSIAFYKEFGFVDKGRVPEAYFGAQKRRLYRYID